MSVTSVTAQKKSRIINRWYGVTDVHFYLCLHHISILLFLLWHKSRIAKTKQKKERWGWTGSWGVKGFGIKNLPLLILLTRKADLRFHHNTALINTFQCRKKQNKNTEVLAPAWDRLLVHKYKKTFFRVFYWSWTKLESTVRKRLEEMDRCMWIHLLIWGHTLLMFGLLYQFSEGLSVQS